MRLHVLHLRSRGCWQATVYQKQICINTLFSLHTIWGLTPIRRQIRGVTTGSVRSENNRAGMPCVLNTETDLDPYAYTSGRWLRNDEQQRLARHIDFDFDALSSRVLSLCPGATSVSRCEKKEGGFNRVFVFTLDDGRRVVARLPFTVAGPPRLRTQSEVATIQYSMCGAAPRTSTDA